jgi:ankyrin repeat protein
MLYNYESFLTNKHSPKTHTHTPTPTQTQLGQTALHGACAAKHADIVARLLRGGADINIKDKRSVPHINETANRQLSKH